MSHCCLSLGPIEAEQKHNYRNKPWVKVKSRMILSWSGIGGGVQIFDRGRTFDQKTHKC